MDTTRVEVHQAEMNLFGNAEVLVTGATLLTESVKDVALSVAAGFLFVSKADCHLQKAIPTEAGWVLEFCTVENLLFGS